MTDVPALPESIQRKVDEYAASVERRLALPPLAPGWKWRIDSEVVDAREGMIGVRFTATPEKVVYFSEE